VVVANTAFALACARQTQDIESCLAEADESLVSGKALNAFNKLLSINKTFAA